VQVLLRLVRALSWPVQILSQMVRALRLAAFSAEDRLLCSASLELVVAPRELARANTLVMSFTPRQFHRAGVGRLPPTPQCLRLLMVAGGQIHQLYMGE